MPRPSVSRDLFLTASLRDVRNEMDRVNPPAAAVSGRRRPRQLSSTAKLGGSSVGGAAVAAAGKGGGRHAKYLKVQFPVVVDDSRAWGFPVRFSPKRDASRRVAAQDARVAAGERRQMEEEERGQRRLAIAQEAHARAHDRILFTELVMRFGPLAGELYCVSSRPGGVYHKLVRDAASRIRVWWAQYYPDHATRKVESAMFLQKVYRGHGGRRTGLEQRRKEALASRMCRRLLFRHVIAAFDGWTLFATRSKRVKAMFLRVVAPLKMESLHAWRKAARELVQERHGRLVGAGKRLLHRRLARPFDTWCALVAQNAGARALLRRHWGSVLLQKFSRWAVWTGQRIAARREIETTGSLRNRALRELRMRAAKFIQAAYMRYLGRVDAQRVLDAKQRRAELELDHHHRRHEEARRVAEDAAVGVAADAAATQASTRLATKDGTREVRQEAWIDLRAARRARGATNCHVFLMAALLPSRWPGPRATATAFKALVRQAGSRAEAEERARFRRRRPGPFPCPGFDSGKGCLACFGLWQDCFDHTTTCEHAAAAPPMSAPPPVVQGLDGGRGPPEILVEVTGGAAGGAPGEPSSLVMPRMGVADDDDLPLPERYRRLRVKVVRASKLARADAFGESDPYCNISWVGPSVAQGGGGKGAQATTQIGRTKVCMDTSSPAWNEEWFIPLPDRVTNRCQLLIDVFDHDDPEEDEEEEEDGDGSDDFLGRVALHGRLILDPEPSAAGRAEGEDGEARGEEGEENTTRLVFPLKCQQGRPAREQRFVQGTLTLEFAYYR